MIPDFYSIVNFPTQIAKKKPRNSAPTEVSRRCVMCGTRCLLATKDSKRKNAGKETADDPTTLHGYLMANRGAVGRGEQEEGGVDLTGLGDEGPIIPTQNKGLCSQCDRAIWIYHVPKEERVEVLLEVKGAGRVGVALGLLEVAESAKLAGPKKRSSSTSSAKASPPSLPTSTTAPFKVKSIPIKWCKGCKNFREWENFRDKGRATKCERCRFRQRTKYASSRDGGGGRREEGGDGSCSSETLPPQKMLVPYE